MVLGRWGRFRRKDPSGKDFSGSWVMLSLEGSAQEASILAWSILPTVLLCVERVGGGRGGGVGEQLLMSTSDRRVCWGFWE